MTSPALTTAPRYLLPDEAYTSRAWFEHECADVFERCWLYAGMSDDVGGPGDYLTVDAGRAPLIVVRQRDGSLAAFHNVCRHRGAVMYDGRGNAGGHLRCFYHSWSYDLDGQLARVPQAEQFPCLDKASLALRPAAVAEWNGMVFVCADPAVEPLADFLAAMPERMGPYRPAELVEVSRQRHVLRANWKLFIENHIDGYHLWHLHSRSIRGLDHVQQRYERSGRHWTFYEPTRQPGLSVDEQGTGLAIIDHIDDDRWYGSAVHHLFPNLGLATQATFWTTIQAIPVGPEETIVETRLRVMPLPALKLKALSAAARIERATQRLRRRLARLAGGSPEHRERGGIGDIVAEDVRAAESVQRGVRAPGTLVGPLAKDYERAITEFQQDVIDLLGDAG